MKKLKAFTLIEMLIVLVIIGIMMMVTLRFGGNFVNDTSFKQERDTLLTDYHIALGHALGSRYIDGDKAYEMLEVERSEGNEVHYRFLDDQGEVAAQTNKYDRLQLSMVEPSPLILQLEPYTLGCSIQGIGTGASARIKITAPELSIKEFCYTLHTSTCKRQQFLGEGEWCGEE